MRNLALYYFIVTFSSILLMGCEDPEAEANKSAVAIGQAMDAAEELQGEALKEHLTATLELMNHVVDRWPETTVAVKISGNEPVGGITRDRLEEMIDSAQREIIEDGCRTVDPIPCLIRDLSNYAANSPEGSYASVAITDYKLALGKISKRPKKSEDDGPQLHMPIAEIFRRLSESPIAWDDNLRESVFVVMSAAPEMVPPELFPMVFTKPLTPAAVHLEVLRKGDVAQDEVKRLVDGMWSGLRRGLLGGSYIDVRRFNAGVAMMVTERLLSAEDAQRRMAAFIEWAEESANSKFKSRFDWLVMITLCNAALEDNGAVENRMKSILYAVSRGNERVAAALADAIPALEVLLDKPVRSHMAKAMDEARSLGRASDSSFKKARAVLQISLDGAQALTDMPSSEVPMGIANRVLREIPISERLAVARAAPDVVNPWLLGRAEPSDRLEAWSHIYAATASGTDSDFMKIVKMSSLLRAAGIFEAIDKVPPR